MVLGYRFCSGGRRKQLGELQYLGVRDMLGGSKLTVTRTARQTPEIGRLACYVDLFRFSRSRDQRVLVLPVFWISALLR